MNNWFIILKGLYDREKIDIAKLDSSVDKGLITEEEKELIISSKTTNNQEKEEI